MALRRAVSQAGAHLRAAGVRARGAAAATTTAVAATAAAAAKRRDGVNVGNVAAQGVAVVLGAASSAFAFSKALAPRAGAADTIVSAESELAPARASPPVVVAGDAERLQRAGGGAAVVQYSVDTNASEAGVFEKLVQLHGAEAVQREKLAIGDIKVTLTDSRELLFERKTWADWKRSQYDGRFQEQNFRLLDHRNNNLDSHVRLFYVLETPQTPRYSPKAHGALHKLQRSNNVTVLWAANSEDLALMVSDIANDFESNEYEPSAPRSYAEVMPPPRKRDYIEKSQFAIMLATIPHVSARKAAVIADAYPTPALLVEACKSCEAGAQNADTLLLLDVLKPPGSAIPDHVKRVFS